MTLNDFYQQLAIPDSCQLQQRIYKKQLFSNVAFSKSDQKRINEQIDTLALRYSLSPETINISRYEDSQREYLEIALLQITLKKLTNTEKQQAKLAELIQKAIPYPTILVFVRESQIAISLAHKRINLADSSKLTLERSFDTGWLDLSQLTLYQQAFLADFALPRCSFINFYQCYQDLVRRVVALNCADLTGHYTLTNDTESDRQTRLDELRSHQQQVSLLRAELKQETRFNHKVELNMQIKRLDQQIQTLKTQL